jgi:hypothetical protein
VTAQLLAAAYLAVAAVVVVIIEAQSGVRLSTSWGLQFVTPVVYPLPFWTVTCVYAYVSCRRAGLAFRATAARTILLGGWVHLNLLAITMGHETDLLALLTAGSFVYYVAAVVGAIAVGSCVLSALCLAAYWKGWRDDFWLPVAYLPLTHILLQRKYGPWLALVEVALAITAVVAVDRDVQSTVFDAASRWWRRLTTDSAVILFIYLVAFFFRFTAARRLSGMGVQVVMTNTDDPDQYHRAALTILKGGWVPRYTSIGYDVFLAALYRVTGVSIGGTLVLQAVLLSTVPVAVYLIGRRLFNPAAGIAAALSAALSQVLIFNSVNLTREVAGSLFAPWGMLLVLLVLARARDQDGEWLALPAGAVFGFLIAYDPAFLIVSICLAAGFLACFRFTLTQRLKRAAVFLMVACLVAVGIVRFATGDRTVLARDDSNLATSVSTDFNPYASVLFQRRISLLAYRPESLSHVLAHPGENITLIAQKLWLDARRFVFEGNAGRFDPITLIQGTFFAANVDFYGYLFGFLGAAAGLGGLLRRPVRLDRAALYLVILSYSAVYVVLFFGMTRFRVAIQPLLLVLVGAGIANVFRFALTGACARRPIAALNA